MLLDTLFVKDKGRDQRIVKRWVIGIYHNLYILAFMAGMDLQTGRDMIILLLEVSMPAKGFHGCLLKDLDLQKPYLDL